MDIKFCKTNLLIEHKELDGKFQFKFTHPLTGLSKLLLPNPELTTVVRDENIDFRPPLYTLVGHEDDLREEEPELDRVEDRAESQAEDRVQESADLGEPECYYFEEYEAPRMNPSVVAAHKRIGLLQKFNKWQGKAIEKMQKSMDKMVSKIKSLEKKVSGSSSKKKKAPMAPLSLGVDHSSPPKEAPCPRASQSLFIRAKGREKTTRREGGRALRPDAPTRPPDLIESKQRKLNSIELRVELTWRSPCLRTRIRVRSNALPRLLSEPLDPTTASSKHSSSKAKGATHTSMKKRKKRSRKLDRARSFGAFWSIWDERSMEDLAHGRSSTGYAKEEGGSHLEDQLDHLLDQPVEFLNSTGQASTRSS
ncbi:unnamed protein product [Microthlaspi erraticum]|uniref:Arabidopsis retrotransposon Orf1 C-terminal domain-containing protein n=1 Tax=Microthlaspi erraticum TaxID=1685480 RepID=A0A6D2K4V3_9BRAS|nr:unnamed protein product [Microthlaspi erraticum]